MTELPIQGVVLQVLSSIERRGIAYRIMGGFAVRAHGVPRPKYDADLTIEAKEGELDGLYSDLEAAGFTIPHEHRGGFRDRIRDTEKVKVQKFEDRHVWDTDLFLVTTEYQRAAFRRRVQVRFLGADRWMITHEDLILHKLLANRRKDLVDGEEILKLHRTADLRYLREWAARLSISPRLETALEEAELR
jgi:hypothetical protein